MKSSLIIGLLVIVTLVIGNWFYASQNGMWAPSEGADTNTEPSSLGQKFSDLLTSGQSLECTYSFDDGKNVSSGTVYMTDGGERIRGDFNFTQSGAGPTEMHMVRVDGYNYMWGSAMPQGIKTQVTAENRTQLFDSADAQMGAMNDNTQYKCVAWRTDPSAFEIPSEIQFMDLGDLSKKMMGAPKIGEATRTSGSVDGSANIDVQAMQCAACDQAGPARDQCRQALGCK